MASLFLTGGSGFVGHRLTAELRRLEHTDVRLLVRSESQRPAVPPTWQFVSGDLGDDGAWTAALTGVDTVVHLAALTGKASRRDHERINRDGTQRLVEASRRAGVRRFVFVSTIAAGYHDRRHYHYANAKASAEAIVMASGLEVLVLRPTMVLGPGSPVSANLHRLATAPVPILFGSGQEVQPIHVDDLAAAIAAALTVEPWPREPVDLGGPVRLPMAELLARIRQHADLPPKRPLRVPVDVLRRVLAFLEPVMLPVLPFTAGQLAAFANVSTAAPHHFASGLPSPERDLDEMIVGSVAGS